MRVEELFFSHAARSPEKEAVVCGAQRISYRELVSSLEITKRPGERIPLHLPNGIEFVRQAYSAFASRAVLVPINTRLAPPEAERLRRDCLQPSADTDENDALILYTSGTTGKAVVAVIQTSAKLTSDAVVAHCRTQLADYKKPRHVFFVDALPRNPQGKVLKPELRIRIRALLGERP